MSRRAPSGPPATEQGIACTPHFDPPYPPGRARQHPPARGSWVDHANQQGAGITKFELDTQAAHEPMFSMSEPEAGG